MTSCFVLLRSPAPIESSKSGWLQSILGKLANGFNLLWPNIFAILTDHKHAPWPVLLPWGPLPLLAPRVGIYVQGCDALIVVPSEPISIRVVLPPSIWRVFPHQKRTANKSGDLYWSPGSNEYHEISWDGHSGKSFCSESLVALTVDPDPQALLLKLMSRMSKSWTDPSP